MQTTKIRIYQAIYISAIGLFLLNLFSLRFELLGGFPAFLLAVAAVAGVWGEFRLERVLSLGRSPGLFGLAFAAVTAMVFTYPFTIVVNGVVPVKSRVFAGTILKKNLSYGKSPRSRDSVPITEFEVADSKNPAGNLRLRVDMEIFSEGSEGRRFNLKIQTGILWLEFYEIKKDSFEFLP